MLYSFRLIETVVFCVGNLEGSGELKVWKTSFYKDKLVPLVKIHRLQWLQI